ncbi:MAG TPA: sulfotransferase domain-containing protein [Candidatus Aminicenantes bacterium]|nr:sulfotransferase domain-containing protein [Candidatus Aminicenantes bacterium]
MELDGRVNYIVSGLERSGTSLLMQVLRAGGVPCAFDTASRPPDENNPRGYFELEGGKIISRLRDGVFPLADYRGRFIKITAYGMKFLPPGEYRIVYTERNIEEVLDSMEKMAKVRDPDREGTKAAFLKLNEMTKSRLAARADVRLLLVSYNALVREPGPEIRRIADFLGAPGLDEKAMAAAVDATLHRNRRPQ